MALNCLQEVAVGWFCGESFRGVSRRIGVWAKFGEMGVFVGGKPGLAKVFRDDLILG